MVLRKWICCLILEFLIWLWLVIGFVEYIVELLGLVFGESCFVVVVNGCWYVFKFWWEFMKLNLESGN